MKKYTLEDLVEYAKADFKFEMGEAYIREICGQYELDADKLDRLVDAWKEIEADPRRLELYKFLTWEMTRNVEDGGPYVGLDLPFETKYPDCGEFLLLLAIAQNAERKVIGRGVPKEYYEPVPGYMIKGHLANYQKTGSCEVHGFAWAFNFYSRAIFHLDRFRFIPTSFDDDFRMYRNVNTGETVGLYLDGCRVDENGERLISHNENGKEAFRTSFRETETEYIGNYMNPTGLVSRQIRHLNKAEWKVVLEPGDWLIALHIPSGEGYTPERLESSMKLALDFFGKYYPDIPVKGFWSGSWLYDPRLSLLLPETSHIVSIQRRFYNYSEGGSGESLKEHLFRSPNPDLNAVEAKSSLQKNALQALKNGNDFATQAMIVMKEDVDGIAGKWPYLKESDLEEFRQVIVSKWK